MLLTTQYLEEADALAEEITVIDHGLVIAHDTPQGLKRQLGGQTLEVRPRDPADLDARDRPARRGRHPRARASGVGPRVGAGRRRRRARRDRREARRRRASPVTELSLRLPEPRRGLLLAHRPRHADPTISTVATTKEGSGRLMSRLPRPRPPHRHQDAPQPGAVHRCDAAADHHDRALRVHLRRRGRRQHRPTTCSSRCPASSCRRSCSPR